MSGEPSGTIGRFEQADRHLRKALPRQHILFVSVGTIIGSGWLFASLAAMSDAGPSAIISWAIAGVMMIVIALSFAEQGAMLPRSGGLVRYPHLTHGSYVGWMIGWTYWVGAIATPALEASAVVTYVGGRFAGLHLVYTRQDAVLMTPRGIGAGVLLMAFFYLLNIFGVRFLAEWNRWFTWWKIVIPILTFCFLFVAFRSSNFTAYGGFFPNGPGAMFQTLSVSGVVFAYTGFRYAIDFGGEARDPQRDVPYAVVMSIVITFFIYVLLQVAILGALRWGNAGVHPGAWSALETSRWAETPLYSALIAAGIPSMMLFGNILLVDAGISPAGTGWTGFGNATRVSYGLAVHGYGPTAMQGHNRFGIPKVPALITFLIGCVYFVPLPSWYKLVGVVTTTSVLTMIMGGSGVMVLRRHAPGLPRPYRLPRAGLMAPAGFVAAVVIIYWVGFETLATVYGAIFTGLPLFTWYYAQRRGWLTAARGWALGLVYLAVWCWVEVRGGWMLRVAPPARGAWPFPAYAIGLIATVGLFTVALWALSTAEGRHHVLRGVWLVALLLALFPLSYYGEFGPLPHPALAFPWGTLIAAAIGLGAYYWSVASGFATDELEDIMAAHRVPSPHVTS